MIHTDNVIYGIHAVEELLISRADEVDRVLFTKSRNSGPLFNIMKTCKRLKISYQHVPSKKLEDIAGSAKNQGVAAICSIKKYADIEDLLSRIDPEKSSPIFLVPASIEDPRNLGALIRSCAAFDVSAVILEKRNTVLLNSTVAKASSGTLEHMAVSKPNNLEKTLKGMAETGYKIVGAESGAGKLPGDIDLSGPVVIIVGGEHRGIPPYLKKICSDFISIPISQTVESLNVSVAASIILYECQRQRKHPD